MSDYTTNEIALLNLINNLNKYFYYFGESDDKVTDSRIKTREKLDEFTSQFMRSIEVDEDAD
jgi:hypothetical protein|tara:strand:- start:294 stop:479 length:186 start_codon:yes stop_codon:yes gene_type:complete